MADLVSDIMTKEIATIDEDETALEAARIMSQRGISSLIVVKDAVPKGLITERDFVKKICSKQLEVSQVKIASVMSRIRTVADPDTPIEVAVQRMANQGIRRLPIMREGKVVGIITVTDLARYLRTKLLLEGALDGDKNTDDYWSSAKSSTSSSTTTSATASSSSSASTSTSTSTSTFTSSPSAS